MNVSQIDQLNAALLKEQENLETIELEMSTCLEDDDQLATLGDQWDDCVQAQDAIKAKIAELQAAEISAKRRELKKNIAKAEAEVVRSTRYMLDPEKRVIFENAGLLLNAEMNALEEFEASLISPEERALQVRIAELKGALDEALAELKEKFPEVKITKTASTPKATGVTVHGTPPKEDTKSEKRARVIELAKQGLSNKEIGIELGYTKEQGYGNGYISPIAKHYR